MYTTSLCSRHSFLEVLATSCAVFVETVLLIVSMSGCQSLSTSAPERPASLEFGAGAGGQLMRGYGGIDWGSSVEEVLERKGNDITEFTGLQPRGRSMLIEDVEEGAEGGGGIKRVHYMFKEDALSAVAEVYRAGEVPAGKVHRALRALYPGEVQRRGPGKWTVGGMVEVSIVRHMVVYEVPTQQYSRN